MRLSILLIVMTATSVVGAQTPSGADWPGAAPAGNAENGKKIFTSYGCYQCHNYAAHGGGAGPRLAPTSDSLSRRSPATSASRPAKCRRTRRRSCRTRNWRTSTRFC